MQPPAPSRSATYGGACHVRWQRGFALALLFAILAALQPRAALAAGEAAVVIDRALVAEGDAASFPTGVAVRTVALPDRWADTRPGYNGSVWYRTEFRLGGRMPTDDLLAVYIERVCTNVQIQLNGFLVFSAGRMTEPVTRNCERPQLVALPSALLRPGENVLDLRVRGHALSAVASVEAAGWLSRLQIGPQAVLRSEHQAAWFWKVTWTDASSLALLGLGCVLIAVGWLNKREVHFSHLGWLCLAWVVYTLVDSARELPWSNAATEYILASGWAVLLGLVAQFLLSFAAARSRVVESLAAVQWVAMPLSLLVVGPERLFDATRIWYAVLAVELFVLLCLYLRAARRRRWTDQVPAVAIAAAGAASATFAVGRQWGWFEPNVLPITTAWIPVAFGLIGVRLFLMFARALRELEHDRNRLVGEWHRLMETMETTVASLTAQRVGQFAEQERKRIASDLHDDLGAKLLTIVHTSDTSRLPDLAREALDEMRLSVRGLAGRSVLLDDAIADWRAEVVGRLEQAGIQPHWETEPFSDSPMLSARCCMQLTRILREAVSNVIKHSGARHCQVRLRMADGAVRLTVKDDGHGIAGDLDGGLGMVSMKRRAKGLSGQCLVESYPGKGVVISLTVPV